MRVPDARLQCPGRDRHLDPARRRRAALGYSRQPCLQEQTNYALADVLTTIGYPVEAFGQATVHLATGPRMIDEIAGDDETG